MITEGSLQFKFSDDCDREVKYDDTIFYRKYFEKLDMGKGLDIVASSPEDFFLVEVKDCLGHERENRWRTKKGKRGAEDCFGIEVAKKTTMTIAALCGAHTKRQGCGAANEIASLFDSLSDGKIPSLKRRIHVFLLLEGDFKTQSRSKKMVMKAVSDEIKKQLSWLECKVHVVDCETLNQRYFSVGRIPASSDGS